MKNRSGIQDIAKELKKLYQYKKKGLITKDDFNKKKKCLLAD